MFKEIQSVIDTFNFSSIPAERKETLKGLAVYLRASKKTPQLHFICTHNSRRSQFCQVWAKVAGFHYGVDVICFSGGTEVTACHSNVTDSLKRNGFKVSSEKSENAIEHVQFDSAEAPVELYSKLIADPKNPNENFAAVMTCQSADEACPVVDGAEVRIALPFVDPKIADGTSEESSTYDTRSLQIATELFYTFSIV